MGANESGQHIALRDDPAIVRCVCTVVPLVKYALEVILTQEWTPIAPPPATDPRETADWTVTRARQRGSDLGTRVATSHTTR